MGASLSHPPAVLNVNEWLMLTDQRVLAKDIPVPYYSKGAFSRVKSALLRRHWGDNWFVQWNERHMCINVVDYRKQWLSNTNVRERIALLITNLIRIRVHLKPDDWNALLTACFDFRLNTLLEECREKALDQYPDEPLLYCF